MADQTTRSRPATLAGSPARSGPAGGEPRRQAARSSSARRPASARPTRCCRPRAPASSDGYDVVVGVVETHGRKETEALLEGLEIIPRRRIEYKGQWLEEMDLDAILARRPQIVLVDELAHTNAPGSRHPKRYLDVEELLEPRHRRLHHRQHPAHRKPERRRRADHPRARARDRAGFDLRPRRRRRAGRPHARRPDPAPQGRQGLRPEAGRARAGALLLAGQSDGAARAGAAPHRRPGRRAAAHRRCRRAPSPGHGRRASASWSASARTRAPPAWCATPSASPTACTRRGRRSTSRRRRSLQLSEEQRDRIADTLRLAQTPRRRGRSPFRAATGASPTTCIAYAHANNITQIIIGKSTPLALVRDPARLGRARSGAPRRQHQRPRHRRRRARRRADPEEDGATAAEHASRSIRGPICVGACSRSPSRSASASLIQPWLGIENVDLVFLTAIVGVAVRFGLWPSLLASVAASLCYNFFFLPPIYTFTITDPTNVAAFVFFIVDGGRSSRTSRRACAPRRSPRWAGRARPSRSTPSAASSPASARSTTCCGRPPIRPR